MLRLAIFVFVFLNYCAQAQVTFVIESLPAATPASDTIFICGTFNNWVPNDPAYALRRQLNGQLAITLQPGQGEHEYKFTRGSWTKVETDIENQYIDNRILTDGEQRRIFISIQNWLDLGGAKDLNYLVFYFFACAFQGIALCLLVYRIQKSDAYKIRAFVIINGVLTGLLGLVVVFEFANQIWQTYFTFVFHIALFFWGPLVYHFLQVFSAGAMRRLSPAYFVPALIAFIFILIRIGNIGSLTFLSGIMLPPMTWANSLIIIFGFIFNVIVTVKILKRFRMYHIVAYSGLDTRNRFASVFLFTSVAGLLLIPLNMMLLISGFTHAFFEDFHMVAIVLSLSIPIETYFLWRYPEILREEKPAVIPSDNVNEWIAKLNDFMVKVKPYKNVDLTVSDLAEMLGAKPHFLSRIINEVHQKNFRDFVNAYRIEEFIALANSKEFKHYTFLALAQEVGFNSKSTFNLAFKKLTNQSPREYFKRGIETPHDVD